MSTAIEYMTGRFSLVVAAAVAALAAAGPGPGYHVVHRFVIGGPGRWDYVAFDTANRRLFVARETRITVLDPESGKVLGEIAGLDGAHGVAFAYDLGRGFAASGRDSTVTIFDLTTLQVLGKLHAAEDADAVLYDPASKRIFTMNGEARSSTVIDPAAGAVVGTIDLAAKPEFAVSAGDGMLYVNLVDKGAIAEVDARAMRVVRQWSIAPCTSPTGLAIDRQHRRLFSGCRNKLMAISDVRAGSLVATIPIGAGVDGSDYDPGTGFAFSSNGEGTVTVVDEDGPGKYRVAETVPTMPGARTMTLDARTHLLYFVSAELGPAPDSATPDNPRRRRPVVPGTFTLLVLGR